MNPVLHEARLRCDPDQAAAVEQHALDHRGVWLDHRESTATTLVTARMDTLDALDLDATVGDLAGLMGRLGDHRHLDVRRASALGMLAHPQRALDLAAGTEPDTDAETGAGLNGSRGTLYLHVYAGRPRHQLRRQPGREARHRLPGPAARLAPAVSTA